MGLTRLHAGQPLPPTYPCQTCTAPPNFSSFIFSLILQGYADIPYVLDSPQLFRGIHVSDQNVVSIVLCSLNIIFLGFPQYLA